MTKSGKNGYTGPDSASITRNQSTAHRRANQIVKNFGLTGSAVDYRKTLVLWVSTLLSRPRVPVGQALYCCSPPLPVLSGCVHPILGKPAVSLLVPR